ncbi:MAG: FhaA domain-containing protein [Chloroflexota bacterium]
MINKLDKFEGFFQRVMEESVGRIFRTPVQPAEIGRRLERAMESNQVVSVEGAIVPNDYRVIMHPQDMVVFADFVPALCRQMEQWLKDLAHERGYGFVDHVRVQIQGDDEVGRRSIFVESAIVELPSFDQAEQDDVQRTEVMRVIQHTGNVPPRLLRFVEGPHSGDSVVLRRELLTIGRALDNDVILDSAEVSRHHARIEYQNNEFRIVDLGSTNGTIVNGQRVETHPLHLHDRIALGNVTLEFQPYEGDTVYEASAHTD